MQTSTHSVTGAVYKIYSSGHNLDTLPVWIEFFRELLSKRLVPALIFSKAQTTPRLFARLSQLVTPQACSANLTFVDDLFHVITSRQLCTTLS